MLSQTVEYSLRAVIVLANHFGEALTVREIADVAKVPGPYLSKVMKELIRSGIVQSRRGLGGGFKLAIKPEEISIWDVMQAIDPIERIHTCPLEIEGHAKLCPLHRRIDDAIAHIEQAFRASSLAEILEECGDTAPLCGPRPDPLVQLTLPSKALPSKEKKKKKKRST